MFKKRYLEEYIAKDLKKKMVFIGGPRQVGKTTMAKTIGKALYKNFSYLNWDNPADRKTITIMKFDAKAEMIIFDEIHKYGKWKNYIKGQFDSYGDRFNILVTGSARLDLYKKGGDSLMGRYYFYRLHPFSLAETLGLICLLEPFKEPVFSKNPNSYAKFKELLEFGGFPEPLLSKDAEVCRRWNNQRLDRLIKEDIRDIESVRDLSALQILVDILPGKVGSLLSLNALREDLEVAFGTIKLWMDVLERFYYHFRIYPFASTAIKSLRKEAKLYLWDWSQVEDKGARLENMVASHLLKICHFLHDAHGHKTELYYLRDIEQREVDFLITVGRQPWLAVEVKNTDQAISKNLCYFKDKLRISLAYQLVETQNVDFIQNGVRVMSADAFLSGLV
ncbi:MAG: ATP-binding protein [bacterium]|nr:ATP-binding protein [bacterium]